MEPRALLVRERPAELEPLAECLALALVERRHDAALGGVVAIALLVPVEDALQQVQVFLGAHGKRHVGYIATRRCTPSDVI